MDIFFSVAHQIIVFLVGYQIFFLNKQKNQLLQNEKGLSWIIVLPLMLYFLISQCFGCFIIKPHSEVPFSLQQVALWRQQPGPLMRAWSAEEQACTWKRRSKLTVRPKKKWNVQFIVCLVHYLFLSLNLLSEESRSKSCWMWARPGRKTSTAPSNFANCGDLSGRAQKIYNLNCMNMYFVLPKNMHDDVLYLSSRWDQPVSPCWSY